MTNELPDLVPGRRTGNETLHSDGFVCGPPLLDFWRWSSSDLVSNATRGVFAEFLVANALGVTLDGVRNEWDAVDLTTPEGITVEVKSAAFVQSWTQKRLSRVSFRIPKTRAWDARTNALAKQARRQAQVYVFALLAHQDKRSIDPLNVNQWRFFVVPTTHLDARMRNQVSISLSGLEKLAGPAVSYGDLAEIVRKKVAQYERPPLLCGSLEVFEDSEP
ncbi:MAG: hypothetical protein AB1898_04615 [Acidobacteriota bacterium]